MTMISHILSQLPRYLWQGFGALVSVFLLLAAWQLGHQLYGNLVLPDPMATFIAIVDMLNDPYIQSQLGITIRRALTGFAIAAVVGILLGVLAGSISTLAVLLRPLATIFMGMPPIAWIVLTMIWFGMSNTSVIFTLVLAIVPITFVGTLQGMYTLQLRFSELADAFSLPPLMRITDVFFPHLFSYVFPSLITALGMSWKVVIMAELLASSDGVGTLLAIANTQLDMKVALALVVIIVGLLLLIEYLVMEPVKREVEKWRRNAT